VVRLKSVAVGRDQLQSGTDMKVAVAFVPSRSQVEVCSNLALTGVLLASRGSVLA